MSSTLRIAMWSGPRNLSTAMMYSFAQRDDTEVIDEPLYAAYLKDTQLKHPFAKQIVEQGNTDIDQVIDQLTRVNSAATVQYQKHISKHLLSEYPVDWLGLVTNVFLIRHPARVICSYHAKDEDPDLSDIGIADQWQIYQTVLAMGQQPLIIDSAQILANPKRELSHLCTHLGIDFQESMLSWTKGAKPYDGIWAPHWYESVWRSEGFGQPAGKIPDVPAHLRPLLDEAMPYFERFSELLISH